MIKVVAIERQLLRPSVWIAWTEDNRQLRICYNQYDSLFAVYEGDTDAIVRVAVPLDTLVDFEYMRKRMLENGIGIQSYETDGYGRIVIFKDDTMSLNVTERQDIIGIRRIGGDGIFFKCREWETLIEAWREFTDRKVKEVMRAKGNRRADT